MSDSPGSPRPAVLCLAHLGWDFIWQRPQQVLSRIARRYPVLYVNEPQMVRTHEEAARMQEIVDAGGVNAYQPVFPDRPGVPERWRDLYAGLIQELMVARGWLRADGQRLVATRPLVGWFYTPTPYYLLDLLPFDVVVYDVMDELANFKSAARDLPQREAVLLERADVVFTGGASLYAARRGRHPNLHLLASGVDTEHFAQALSPDTELPSELAGVPHPVLGYYGAIDERLDLDLLDAVAAERPDWSIVMVGPVIKIAPQSLPRRPNLYYPGIQPYMRLPAFLKGFDVCLMPFAINDATRFISPTKTLEYMAARCPIVSTPVPDVMANWGDVVRMASDKQTFVAAVEAAMSETENDRAARRAREDEILARSTWDHIAARMLEELDAVLDSKIDRRPRLSPGGDRQMQSAESSP